MGPETFTGTTFIPEPGETLQSSNEHLALDDAENPLQLLARATDLRISSPHYSEVNNSTPSDRNLGNEREDVLKINQFFQPIKATLNRGEVQNGQDTDPIEVGLVTIEEADMLFSL